MSFQHPAQTRSGHQASTPYPFTALAPPQFPSRPGSSILTDCHSEGSLTVDNYASRWTGKDIVRSRCQRQLITFDMLPDDVLLEIFDFDVEESRMAWITLVHVCRRWRSVVFQSSLRLNLRLLCTPKTPARDTLDIWPPLPLIIRASYNSFDGEPSVKNIIAALERNDRVCQIDLYLVTNSRLGYVTNSAAMQKPFPELTHLHFRLYSPSIGPILPDSFLGGTAPRLRSLSLNGVPFPRLPNLLLSATHLVLLSLHNIPRSGYIPPEAMATSLSALANLESLRLHFLYSRPGPSLGSRRLRLPPLTRSILPSLTEIGFVGASEYLEEILARIDAPRLDELRIVFFNQIIFDTPQLFPFINRIPTPRAPENGRIVFSFVDISVQFPSQTPGFPALTVAISCGTSDWQLSSLEQVCTSSLPPFSTLKDLYIFDDRKFPPHWQDDVENTLWLDLLRSFVAVKNLYLSDEFVPRIAPALQELVGGRTTEVLPTLENISLENISLMFQSLGPLHEGIEKFVAARRLTSHPVAVSQWYRDPNIFDW